MALDIQPPEWLTAGGWFGDGLGGIEKTVDRIIGNEWNLLLIVAFIMYILLMWKLIKSISESERR